MSVQGRRPRRMRPPRLAEGLVALVAPACMREDVLGDLHERYADGEAQAGYPALAYWREAARSIPSLLGFRLRQVDALRLGLLALASVAAFLCLTYWDVSVARRLASGLATQSYPPPLLAVRVLYFLMLFLGAMFAGAMVAGIAFRRARSFWRNALVALAPLVVFLAALIAASALDAQEVPSAYLGLRLVVIVAALVSGAYVTAKLRKAT